MSARIPSVQTHYSVLKVSEDAPAEVIRAAYRSLSSKYHPDHNGQSAEAGEAMAAINRAYAVLSDPIRRGEHDHWIRYGDSGRCQGEVKAHARHLPTRLIDARIVLIRYRRYWGGLAGAGLMAVAAYAMVPAFDDRDGAWLGHAWQQAWRGGTNTTPVTPVPTSVYAPTGEPVGEGGFGRGLNWETSLKK